ncbi:hypothetical protein P4O66_014768, partial [Electrophorus voltai]
ALRSSKWTARKGQRLRREEEEERTRAKRDNGDKLGGALDERAFPVFLSRSSSTGPIGVCVENTVPQKGAELRVDPPSLFGTSRQMIVQRRKGEHYHESCVMPTVVENPAMILWDFQIQKDKMANQADTLVMDTQQKRAVVIDVTILSDRNIRTKEHEKLEKHQGLKEELERMWG